MRLLAVAALAAVSAGCVPDRVRLRGVERAYTADDYPEQLEVWTRKVEVYQHFESRIFLWSTFESWPFLQSQIAHRAEAERLPPEDVSELRARAQRIVLETHSFVLAVQTNQWAWNNLDSQGKDRLWTIHLLNDQGDSVEPVSVERVGSNDPRYNPLFPYFKPYYVVYVVRFPHRTQSGQEVLRPGIGRFTLRVSGPPAAADLDWEVSR